MPCYRPMKGYKARDGGIVFSRPGAYVDRPLEVPCGQCIGCRLERSRQWAVRCMHEASLYENNCFITLTYDNENLPADGSLNVSHYQNFMKRLRKQYGAGIRFYHCGEYGETTGRPHYHALLFNHDFEDRKFWKKQNGNDLYVSKSLERLWPSGLSSVGSVSFQSASYVAGYIQKKITGDAASSHYERICPETGEVTELAPEYSTMSRRPGIGQPWLDKFKTDVYPRDEVIMNGRQMRPPRFYDKAFELDDPVAHKRVRRRRIKTAQDRAADNTPERLKVRATVARARLERFKRDTEK